MRKNTKKVVLMTTIILLFVVGCASEKEKIDIENFSKSTNSSPPRNIDGKDALKIIKSNENFLLLDVRTPSEYQELHIEGSINIPLNELEKRLYELKSYKNNKILVYCKSGNRSSNASEILFKNGFTDIINMEDGLGEFDYFQ